MSVEMDAYTRRLQAEPYRVVEVLASGNDLDMQHLKEYRAAWGEDDWLSVLTESTPEKPYLVRVRKTYRGNKLICKDYYRACDRDNFSCMTIRARRDLGVDSIPE